MSTIRKLSSTDGFVVVDYPDAPATGVLRVARKILQSSATDLCRSATFTFATFGLERSGASAGLNAEGDAVGPGLAALSDELAADAEADRLRLLPAKGVPDDVDLQAIRGDVGDEALEAALVESVVASLRWALGADANGSTVAIEQSPTSAPPDGLAPALAEAGFELVDVPGAADKPWMIWGAKADAIIAGSKPGTLTHQGAPMVKASAVVPWGPIPVTTRALAMLQRQGVVYVPDFVSCAGPLLASARGAATGSESVSDAVTGVLSATTSGPDGLFLELATGAEDFLRSWRDALPFGRPLAA